MSELSPGATLALSGINSPAYAEDESQLAKKGMRKERAKPLFLDDTRVDTDSLDSGIVINERIAIPTAFLYIPSLTRNWFKKFREPRTGWNVLGSVDSTYVVQILDSFLWSI